MKHKELYKGLVSVCTLLTLVIVILDYFGFGKEFWKKENPASVYSDSQEKKDSIYKIIDEVVEDMDLQEEKEILRDGEKLMMSIQFHIKENSKYALNELKPEVNYYSKEFGVLFYTSHEFEYEGKERCKKLTIEWPKSLKVLKPIGTNTYCLADGEWKQI